MFIKKLHRRPIREISISSCAAWLEGGGMILGWRRMGQGHPPPPLPPSSPPPVCWQKVLNIFLIHQHQLRLGV